MEIGPSSRVTDNALARGWIGVVCDDRKKSISIAPIKCTTTLLTDKSVAEIKNLMHVGTCESGVHVVTFATRLLSTLPL